MPRGAMASPSDTTQSPQESTPPREQEVFSPQENVVKSPQESVPPQENVVPPPWELFFPRGDVQHLQDFMRIMSVPGGSIEAIRYLLQRYQIEQFLKGMVEVQAAAEARRVLKGLAGPLKDFPECYSVENMLTYQQVPIGASLLKIESALQPHAVKIFQEIMRFTDCDDERFISRMEELAIVQRIYSLLWKHAALRDEVAAQLQKQTRFNPYMFSCFRAWELMRLLLAVFPTSPAFAGPLSEYFRSETLDEEAPPTLHQLVLAAWGALDRSLKAGPRKYIPSSEEIEFFMDGKTLSTVVYLYNGGSEPLSYDMVTTVGNTLKIVAGALKLQELGSFGLFEVRKLKGLLEDVIIAEDNEPIMEHIRLEPNRYIADIVAEGRANGGRGFTPCKLLLKKRVFRFTDDIITEPTFINLSYIQVRHDFVEGYYPVSESMAMELVALQLAADIGPYQSASQYIEWATEIVGCVPPQFADGSKSVVWQERVKTLYEDLGFLSKDDAKLRALRVLLELPDGGSVFFTLRRSSENKSEFPKTVIMGINKRGVRCLDRVGKAVLHSVDFKDIEEYAANENQFYISMIINGEPCGLEFTTAQGEEICALLDAHISDALRFAPPSSPATAKIDLNSPSESKEGSPRLLKTPTASETSGEPLSPARTPGSSELGNSLSPIGNILRKSLSEERLAVEKRTMNSNGLGDARSKSRAQGGESSSQFSSPSIPVPVSGSKPATSTGSKSGRWSHRDKSKGEGGNSVPSSEKSSQGGGHSILPFLTKGKNPGSPLPKSKLRFSDTNLVEKS